MERAQRRSAPAPEGTSIRTFAVSPNGRYLAVVGAAGGQRQLWVRPLDSLEPQALPGTEGALFPFWSPDSAYIAFFAEGKLKKIAVAGGQPQTLCDAPNGRSGTWNREGNIVFAPSNNDVLYRVPARRSSGKEAAGTTA